MTILGIVMTTITGVLITASKIAPDQQGRSQFASQSQVFVDQLSDDVANAKIGGVTANELPGFTTTSCTTPASLSGQPLGFKGLYSMSLADGSTAAYSVMIFAIAGESNYKSVKVYRGGIQLLQAYCHAGDANIVKVSYNDPTYTLDLNVMTAYPNGESRQIAFTAVRRVYSP